MRKARVPRRALHMQEIEILQRGGCDQSAVNRMEGDALLDRVRNRLAFVGLRQFVLRMCQRMQLRRLLRKQHHKGEKHTLQRAPALIDEKRHGRMLVELGRLRYLTRHCFSP